MLPFTAFNLLSILATFVVASPVKRGNGISVSLMVSPRLHHDERALQERWVQVAPVNTQKDLAYSFLLDIGEPKQSFWLWIDTGSTLPWVYGSDCTNCAAGVPLFDTSQSSTYKHVADDFKIQYSGAGVTGARANDKAYFMGIGVDDLELGVIPSAETFNLTQPRSGLIGLSRDPKTWWSRTVSQWDEPNIGIFFRRFRGEGEGIFVDASTQNFNDDGGLFRIGGTDPDIYDGNIHHLPSLSEFGWSLPLTGMVVNGKWLSFPPAEGASDVECRLDTGNSFWSLPVDWANQIADAAGGQLDPEKPGEWWYNCDSPPAISMVFDGVEYPINPIDLYDTPVPNRPGLCKNLITGAADHAPGIMDTGTAFLKNVYMVARFDPNDGGLSLARLKDGVQNGGVPPLQGIPAH